MVKHNHLDNVILREPRLLLTNYQRDFSHPDPALTEAFCQLAEVKRKAVLRNDQDLAKAVWCLETIAVIQQEYLALFTLLKQAEYYAAWCSMEQVEIMLFSLSRHLLVVGEEYGLASIRASTVRWQSLYPYTIFASPEILKIEVKCGICDAIVSLRKGCGHRINELYDGKLCYRKVTKAELLGISLVENPVQKYSAVFTPDPAVSGGEPNREAYPLVQYVISGLASPWERWSIKRTTTRHPHGHFSHVPAGDLCPCVAPQGTYEQCCLPLAGVLRPHVVIGFQNPPAAPIERIKYL